MSAADVLERANTQGVALWIGEGGKLHWRCPGGLPAELREALADHKADLLGLLARQAERLAAELALEVDEIERRDFSPAGFPDSLARCIGHYLAGPTIPPAEGLVEWWAAARREVLRMLDRAKPKPGSKATPRKPAMR
jgi:hypothetical protein